MSFKKKSIKDVKKYLKSKYLNQTNAQVVALFKFRLRIF